MRSSRWCLSIANLNPQSFCQTSRAHKKHNRQVNFPAWISLIGDVCKKAFARARGINCHFEAIMDCENITTRQEDKLQRTCGHEVNKGHRDAFQRLNIVAKNCNAFKCELLCVMTLSGASSDSFCAKNLVTSANVELKI